MAPRDLILRCYAEKKNGQWQAFCIDLTLAAQGESLEDVKRKLYDMIAEYVHDAMAGQDKEYAVELLSRRAPVWSFAKYYVYKLLPLVLKMRTGFAQIFSSNIPLMPITQYGHAQ